VSAEVFLDTSYAVALSSEPDQHHDRANGWADRLEAEGTRLVTTRAVLLEIGNSLAKRRFRPAAVQLLVSIETDPNIVIVPLTEPLYAQALALFQKRPDKEWGLIDCISFVVMNERGLTEALTADEHFEQAGFKALLRHEFG
jgi:predicted nucleic acid-binding protein